jgi:hypothetical protein
VKYLSLHWVISCFEKPEYEAKYTALCCPEAGYQKEYRVLMDFSGTGTHIDYYFRAELWFIASAGIIRFRFPRWFFYPLVQRFTGNISASFAYRNGHYSTGNLCGKPLASFLKNSEFHFHKKSRLHATGIFFIQGMVIFFLNYSVTTSFWV